MPGSAGPRWERRRFAAFALRAAIMLAPLAASVAAMAILSRALPTPSSGTGTLLRLGWWAGVLLGSLAAMVAVDRLMRRLAPLAALLDMAVLFPGAAPSRFKVARHAGDLRELEKLRAPAPDASPSDLSQAAERILSLVGALRAHDRRTRGHSERVRVYTDLIAEELRLPTAAIDRLRWAALLHDIGKLAVPAATLNKPAKLSPEEWLTMREHPREGAKLAAALLPWLGEWGRAIAEHHERYDGRGYPYGLAGREISLAGRIVAVADAFEVMTAARTYKKAMTRGAALEELVRMSGTQFDPDVVRALLHVSTPRLRWAMGPTSWLVGTPVLGAAPSLTAAGVATQAAVGVTTVAVASVTGLTVPAGAAVGGGAPSATVAPTAIAPTATATPTSGRATSSGQGTHAVTAPSRVTPTEPTDPAPSPVGGQVHGHGNAPGHAPGHGPGPRPPATPPGKAKGVAGNSGHGAGHGAPSSAAEGKGVAGKP